jgi:hypothetical protein
MARVNFHIYFDRVVMEHLEARFHGKYDVEKEVITSGSSTQSFLVPVDPGALYSPRPRKKKTGHGCDATLRYSKGG